MDRSLWLLLVLRSKSLVRQWGRNLRSVKGIILALVGSLVFLPSLISILLAPASDEPPNLERIRRYGAAILFAYCVINVFLSTGERALYYSPAEVDFLFPGPYRQRQLLIYRLIRTLGGTILTALLFTIISRHNTALAIAAFVGVLLAVQFLSLFALVLGLLSATVRALAFNRGRKLGLLLVALIGLALLVEHGASLRGRGGRITLEPLERSALVRVVLAPFQPFVMAYTAERVWPDLVAWGSLGLAIDLLLVFLALAINAQYLEAAAENSARIYTRLQKARRGVWIGSVRARSRVPMFPWWGGIGPNLWRQATTASRSLVRLLPVFLFLLMPALFALLPLNGPGAEIGLAPWLMLGASALFVPAMVGFDFRLDVDHIETLKTLPIRPWRLVLGQVLAPTAILVVAEWLSVGLIGFQFVVSPTILAGVCALIVPLNLMLVEIENVGFLLYPTRVMVNPALDFQAMGRQILLGLAKLMVASLIGGVAAGLGAAVYWLSGGNWIATLAMAWLAVVGGAVSLIPLVALAFTQFDVARDTPA